MNNGEEIIKGLQVKASPIEDAFAFTAEAINTLEKKIEQLYIRLEPIMSEEPTEEGYSNDSYNEKNSIVSDIREKGKRINISVIRLEKILSQLDL